MTITLNIKDLNHYTRPRYVEAYRRALEIRGFAGHSRSAGGPCRLENFRWTTSSEVEEVTIDHHRGTLVYSVCQNL